MGYLDGIIFASFILAYTAFRWFNHFFRVPSNAASGPEWLTPLIYVLTIAVCIIVILFRARRLPKRKPKDGILYSPYQVIDEHCTDQENSE
jgi:prolipoprotein diacylglyceryltransferase